MASERPSNSAMYRAQQHTCNIFWYILYLSQYEIKKNVPFEVPTGRHMVFETYDRRVQLL
jgi:hypothetical protein